MRWSRVARAADLAVVVVLVVTGQLQAWTSDHASGPAVHSVLVGAATVPLLVRRRHPLPVLAVVVVAAWLQFRLGGGLAQPFFGVALATYSVGAWAARRPALVGLAVTMACLLAVDVPRLRDGEPWDDVLPAWGVMVGLWALGRWVRSRRRELDRLAEEATTMRQTREVETRAAVAAERARIARELHDLVAHSVGIIVIQSQAAQRVLSQDPAAAHEALRAIESSGRQGMAEMRRLLGVLVDGRDEVPHGPQPGVRDLDALVGRVRDAGLDVRVQVDGEPRALPPGVDLSTYRIAQEALTNVLRHSGAAAATVRIGYTATEVSVEVVDDGPGGTGHGGTGQGDDGPGGTGQGETGPGEPTGGRGLIGMRERVAVFGGRLETGRLPGGGWRVHATLPLEAAEVEVSPR